MKEKLACPKCHGQLKKNESGFSCLVCRKNYLADEYLDFSSSTVNDWEQLTEEQYQELFDNYEKMDWQSALTKTLLKHWNQYLVDYNTSPERYLFVDEVLAKHVDLSQKEVLEIGCSFGNMSRKLAQRSRSVVAVDTPKNVIKWLLAMKNKDGIDNLYPLRIDNLDYSFLPFRDESFDVVVLGMTLQWVGTSSAKESPDAIQQRLLKDIFRVLKRGGVLCFFDKNRYSYSYLINEPDPSTLMYASFLPRRIADLYVQLMSRISGMNNKKYFRFVKDVTLASSRYRNYRHCFIHIKKMIGWAGFSRINFYLPLPAVRFQKLFIPLDNEKAGERLFARWFDRFVKELKGHPIVRLIFKLSLKLRLSRYLADGYLIIAKK
ncbi:MAG: class I SAM-dependent methyltransferase [Candidatus Margulisiibacteriota bacterium]